MSNLKNAFVTSSIERIIKELAKISKRKRKISEIIDFETIENFLTVLLFNFWYCSLIFMFGLIVFLCFFPLNGKTFVENASINYEYRTRGMDLYEEMTGKEYVIENPITTSSIAYGKEQRFVTVVLLIFIGINAIVPFIAYKLDLFEYYWDIEREGGARLHFVNSSEEIERLKVYEMKHLVSARLYELLQREIHQNTEWQRFDDEMIGCIRKGLESATDVKRKEYKREDFDEFYTSLTEDILLEIFENAYNISIGNLKTYLEEKRDKELKEIRKQNEMNERAEMRLANELRLIAEKKAKEETSEDEKIERIIKRVLDYKSKETWVCGFCGHTVSADKLSCPHCNGVRMKAMVK